MSGRDDQDYSYEFCYSAQSDGFYADISSAPPGYTDIRLKEALSKAFIKNTTPNRQAPPKLMLVAFRALYNLTLPVCTTEGVGTGIYIGTDDTPEFCSVSWAGYAQNARGISMDIEGATEISSRSSAALENIPESSAPPLIHALHQPHSLVLLVDIGDRDVLHLPNECQVEVPPLRLSDAPLPSRFKITNVSASRSLRSRAYFLLLLWFLESRAAGRNLIRK